MNPYVIAALLVTLVACKKDEIQVYKVAKPSEGAVAPAQPMPADHPALPGLSGVAAAAVAAASGGTPPAGLPDGHPPIGSSGMGTLPPEMAQMAVATPLTLAWKAPGGWQSKPASGMRRATFVIPGSAGPAELSVISLPGDAGGDLANVNRWRGQVGLSAWDEAAFKKASMKVSSPAGTFTVVDLAGGPQRMAAAILMRNGESWFFKLLGPDGTVGGSLPDFKSFLATVKPAA